ncbi:MAG: hypothetical protein SD837_22065 [Candidatus Electrothrix scaldis]|nr:MAG: hypothetical protein SD837_22065 [Candidatus Electrothrix sp. GW3-3]
MPLPFDNFLFEAFSQLTGGLITDMKTLLLGMLFLGMVLIGFDMLTEKLQSAALARRADGNFKLAQWAHLHREASDAGSFEFDYYNALYHKHLQQSVSIKSSRYNPGDYDV